MKLIVYKKNNDGELVAYEIVRTGRYRDLNHLKSCLKDCEIIEVKELDENISEKNNSEVF